MFTQRGKAGYDEGEKKMRRIMQIDKTFSNFDTDTNLDDPVEAEWKTKLEEAGTSELKSYPIYKRAEGWHQAQQDRIRGQAFAANRKEKAIALTCPKKGVTKFQKH